MTKSPHPAPATAGPGSGSFEDTRAAETLSRLQRATFVLLVPFALALAVSVRVFGDTTPLRTLGLVAMMGLTVVTHLFVQRQQVGRRGVLVAIAFVGTLAAIVLGTLAEAGEHVHAQVGVLSALLLGAAVLLPWGPVPQTIVAIAVLGGYLYAPALLDVDPHELRDYGFVLIDVVALSVIGSWALDRQRRTIFAEREQSRLLLRQQQVLLDAGRELNASLDLDETVAAIARVAERAFDVDTVALVLVDAGREMLCTVAVVGNLAPVDREMQGLEVPLAPFAPLLSMLHGQGVVCVPDALPELAELMRDHFAIRASLYAAIEHQGALLGYLVFNYRRANGAFAPADVTLARGFATCCATALAKGRLVSDLQRANRVKNEFVSTMSHELRTPLHVILGYADLLADLVDDPDGRRGVDRIQAASRELLDLIEATLDINRLESGSDPARVAPLVLAELWEELASEFSALPAPTGVRQRWEVAPGLTALTDRRKLKIIVKNLVGNARKFTRAGDVVATATLEGERCVIRVCDTGVGIPAEHLGSVFEMFRQVDSSDRRSFGGVGLGLYIVRKLAEQLGASVDVASTVGEGSTFTVSLPLAPAERAAAA
jgi:signal transduction histidine kinase